MVDESAPSPAALAIIAAIAPGFASRFTPRLTAASAAAAAAAATMPLGSAAAAAAAAAAELGTPAAAASTAALVCAAACSFGVRLSDEPRLSNSRVPSTGAPSVVAGPTWPSPFGSAVTDASAAEVCATAAEARMGCAGACASTTMFCAAGDPRDPSDELTDASLEASWRRFDASPSPSALVAATLSAAVTTAAAAASPVSLATVSAATLSASDSDKPACSMSSIFRRDCFALSESRSMRAVGPARQK
mmetsp:Transcript_13223/g.51789  ORF Transcript_13223/g.51789 Transcript_13223/m.51789 type:complete len:248 (-) Transcript_13223:1520-2263(-)